MGSGSGIGRSPGQGWVAVLAVGRVLLLLYRAHGIGFSGWGGVLVGRRTALAELVVYPLQGGPDGRYAGEFVFGELLLFAIAPGGVGGQRP